MTDCVEKTDARVWRVLLCLTPAKLAKLQWGDIDALAAQMRGPHRAEITLVAPEALAKEQREFDVAVTKVTDQIVACAEAGDGNGDSDDSDDSESSETAAARRELAAVEAYLAAHPETVAVDPVPVQRLLCRRDVLCDTLAALCAAPVPAPGAPVVRGARYCVGGCAGLRFPVMCKRVGACGIPASHRMAIAFGPRGVAAFAAGAGSVVCQEYVNHGARLHKVFCVGPAHVFVHTRPSLPDLAPAAPGAPEPAPLLFDNARPTAPQVAAWAAERPECFPAAPAAGDAGDAGDTLDTALVEAIARRVSAAFGGVRLFGFDVVVERGTGDAVVLDVNYFSSYRGCLTGPQFFDVLLDTLATEERDRAPHH